MDWTGGRVGASIGLPKQKGPSAKDRLNEGGKGPYRMKEADDHMRDRGKVSGGRSSGNNSKGGAKRFCALYWLRAWRWQPVKGSHVKGWTKRVRCKSVQKVEGGGGGGQI